MQQSPKLQLELDAAKEAVQRMRTAATLDDFELNWIIFLRSIERTWNKFFAHYKKSPKWHSWSGKYSTLRKKDELLAYLENARGAEEHSLQDITGREGGQFQLTIDTRAVRLGEPINFTCSPSGFEYSGEGVVSASFAPAKVILRQITNRGVPYAPPTTHLGNPIEPTDVVKIAEHGLSFYQSLLQQGEKYFVG